jgi:hypothetical protein
LFAHALERSRQRVFVDFPRLTERAGHLNFKDFHVAIPINDVYAPHALVLELATPLSEYINSPKFANKYRRIGAPLSLRNMFHAVAQLLEELHTKVRGYIKGWARCRSRRHYRCFVTDLSSHRMRGCFQRLVCGQGKCFNDFNLSQVLVIIEKADSNLDVCVPDSHIPLTYIFFCHELHTTLVFSLDSPSFTTPSQFLWLFLN